MSPIGSPQTSSPGSSGATGHAQSLWQTSGAAKAFGSFVHFIIKCTLMPTHGNYCLGTGVGTCSGESAGWIVATREADRDLWEGGRPTAGWPNLGHLGTPKDLWGFEDLFGKKKVGRNWGRKEAGSLTLQPEDFELLEGWRPCLAQLWAARHIFPQGWLDPGCRARGRVDGTVVHLRRLLNPSATGKAGRPLWEGVLATLVTCRVACTQQTLSTRSSHHSTFPGRGKKKKKETQKLYPIRTGQKSGALRRSSWQENSQGASSRRPGTETPSYQPRDVRSHLLLAGE